MSKHASGRRNGHTPIHKPAWHQAASSQPSRPYFAQRREEWQDDLRKLRDKGYIQYSEMEALGPSTSTVNRICWTRHAAVALPDISGLIRHAREQKGMTQSEVARQLQVWKKTDAPNSEEGYDFDPVVSGNYAKRESGSQLVEPTELIRL